MDVDEIANELRSFGDAMFPHTAETPDKPTFAITENGQKPAEALPPIVAAGANSTTAAASESKNRRKPLVKNTFSGGVRFFAPTENKIPLDYENDDSSPFEPNRPRFLLNRSDRRIFLPDDHGERPYMIFGDIEDKINELQLNPEPSDIRYAIEMRNKQDKAYFKKIASDPHFTPPSASYSRKSQNSIVRYDDDADYIEPSSSSSKKTEPAASRDVDRFTAKNAMRKKIGLPTPKVNVSMMVDSSSAATIKRPVLAEQPDFEPKRLSAEEQLKIDAGSLLSEVFARGTRVLAKWADKHFYPGVIVRNDVPQGYKIRFMDGEFRDMNQTEFVPLFKLKPGDELVISVTSKKDMYQFIPCRITRVPSKKIAKEWFEGMFYVENRASSNEEKVPWTKLVIESRQVKNYVNNIKRTAMASSLEASMGIDPSASSGRRSLRPKRPRMAFETNNGADSDEDYTPGRDEDNDDEDVVGPEDGEDEEYEGPKKAKKGQQQKKPAPKGPKRTTIPPHQVLRTPISEQRPPSLTAEGRLFENSNNNNKTESMLVVKPFQQIDRTIFKGMKFVLTSATRPKDSQSSNDDAVIPPIMPFVKRRVREMIEERGGEVYEDFHQLEGEDTSNCYLVADQFYRTHKYLSALVRAVPCVSHMWIFECCKENQFLHPTIFMLPAGRSLENNQVLKWHNKCPTLLQGCSVYLYTQNRPDTPNTLNFVQIWTPIAKLMGAKIIEQLPTDITDPQAPKIDILLTDSTCTPNIVDLARTFGARPASSEWLIQGIIAGRLPALDAHPKYKYDYGVEINDGSAATPGSTTGGATSGQQTTGQRTTGYAAEVTVGAMVPSEAPPTLAVQSPMVVQQSAPPTVEQQREQQYVIDATHFMTSPNNAGGGVVGTAAESTVIDISQMTAEDLRAMGIELVDADDLARNVEMTSATAVNDVAGLEPSQMMTISAEDLAALQREGVQIFDQDGMLIIQQMDGTTATLMTSSSGQQTGTENHN